MGFYFSCSVEILIDPLRKSYVYIVFRGFDVKERRSGVIVFTKSILKKAVNFLLKNSSFELGNRIFGQINGISMGLDLAPFFF